MGDQSIDLNQPENLRKVILALIAVAQSQESRLAALEQHAAGEGAPPPPQTINVSLPAPIVHLVQAPESKSVIDEIVRNERGQITEILHHHAG